MIALPGLLLVTGRFDDAKKILKTYAKYCKDGLIPNRFSEQGNPEYNSVDASLWFVYAVYKFLKYTNDYDFVKNNLWNALKEIILANEIFKKTNPESAQAFKDAQRNQSPLTKQLVAEIKA